MKKLIYVVFAMLVFASCSKSPDKVLPKKDGKWKYTSTSSFNGGGISFTFNSTGKMTFTDDEVTDVIETEDGAACTDDCSSSYKWSYDKDDEEITLTEIGTVTQALVFKVSDLERKSETWTLAQTDASGTLTITVKLEADR
ncbi:MAG: hypothetical protein IPO27_08785 [Bacteroidetes bacterium]|nr:hypothetical protein [Bacteroidota bacterium]